MSTIDETRPRLVQLDEKIIKLIAERANHCAGLRDNGDPVTSSEEAELTDYWLEMAAEYELNDESIEQISDLVTGICSE